MNFGSHVIQAPIEAVSARRRGRRIFWHSPSGRTASPGIDVLIGGPPCQGFSRLNRRASAGDPRNKLWQHYYRLLEELRPSVFVLENVPELLSSPEFLELHATATAAGYKLHAEILNAADYGVPQCRRRAFVVGAIHTPPTLPKPSGRRRTVRDALRGLPRKPTNRNLHIERRPSSLSLRRYACVPIGGNRFDLPYHLLPGCWKRKKTGSTDVFGRMRLDRPAPTIRTEFTKPEKGRYLHPTADRAITLREGARLQTFPDSFKFAGSGVHIARQIGNAVPVRLAQAVARHISDRHFSA